MWVTEDVLQWLVQNQIVFYHDVQQTGEDRYEFIRSVVLNFENGLLFGKIAGQMATQIARQQKRPETPLPQLDGLKELNSPSAKIYNWNILVQVFKKFSVTVDPDVKSLIIAGDHEMIQELLKELQAVSFTWNPPPKTTQQTQMYPSQLGSKGGASTAMMKQQKEYKETIDLTKLDLSKDITKVKSCLEFFIIILSKHLELDPKQTASLFTHGNKYLAHVLAKGVKGLFDPIIAFYTEVYSNVSTLIRLFNEDPTHKSLNFSLNALKPGLVAKSFDVAEWAGRLFSKLAFEFNDNILLMHAWEWFVGQEGQGLNMVLLGLKRHPDLKALVVSTLLQFARFNFVELFTTHLKRGLPDPKDLLNAYTQLLPSLMESKLSREELVSTGILDDWIDSSFDALADEFKNYDLKSAGLNFLVEVWLTYPAKIEDQEMKANNLINYLAKSVREKSQSLQYTSLVLQFRLLLQFGLDKNPYAPIIYKTLTLSLIENNSNSQMREFILNNFITIFETIENIPLHILVEPLIRQIQVTEQNQFVYNVFDFNFFNYISKHDKIQIKNAILLLDLLAKVYLNNFVYAQLAMVPILNIVSKNIENDSMQEFVIKFVKISLAMFFASEKKKRPKDKILPLYNGKAANQQTSISPQELDAQIISAQKRSLIVQMIKNIVQLGSGDLNEKIKPLVAHTNIQIKAIRSVDNKGMMSILEQFGDAEAVMKKYEDEFKEHQKLLKQEERDALDKEQEILAQSIEKYEFGDQTKDETLLLIEQNLSKYGIGHKHTKLTKDEMTRLALLRNPKASKKTLTELKQIKENFANKMDLTRKIDEQNQTVLDVRKKVNRSTLAKRSNEQGVGNFNQVDQEKNLIYEFGKREQQLTREGKLGIPQISFIDLETEEVRDKEMVTSLMKKYSKALRYIFLKYANTGFNIKQKHAVKNTFDELKQAGQQLSVPESWKMILEFGINKKKGTEVVTIKQDQYYKELTVNKERVKKSKLDKETGMYTVTIERYFDLLTPLENELILKLTNKWMNEQKDNKKKGDNNLSVLEKNKYKYTHSQEDAKYASSDLRGNKKDLHKPHQNLEKTENQNLDYEAFYFYFIQISIFSHSRYPCDLRHLPMSFAIQATIDQIRKTFQDLKLNTTLFDNPEGAHFGEDEVINKFNEELKKNPNFILPQGYTVKKEKEINFDYSIPQIVKGGEKKQKAYNECYTIVNDIIKQVGKQIGGDFQLFEPKSTAIEVSRAHPLFNDGMQGKAQFYDLHMKPQLPQYHKLKPQKSVNESIDVSQLFKKPDGSYQRHMKDRATKSSENLFQILPGSTFNGYVNKYGKQRNLKIESHHKMSLSMKLSISQFDYKNRWTAEQVGFVLDDMIKVIEHNDGRTFVKEGLYHPDNDFKKYELTQAEIKKNQEEKEKQLKLKKRQNMYNEAAVKTDANGRQMLPEDQRPEITDKKEKKRIEEYQKKLEEKQRKKEEEEEKKKKELDEQKEKEKKKQEERERWVQKQKEKANKLQEEKKQKQLEEQENKQKMEKEAKKKQQEEFKKFNQQEKEKMEGKFNQITNTRKEQQEQQRKNQQLLKPKREKLYKKIIESDSKRMEFEKDTEKKILEKTQSDEIQLVFKKYEFQLQNLFKLLTKSTFRELGDIQYDNEITLKTFNWFCFHFSIYPECMHYVDSILIFRSCTQNRVSEQDRQAAIKTVKLYENMDQKTLSRTTEKEKQSLLKAQQILEIRDKGMTYEIFLEALVRIACKGKNIFNSFADNLKIREDDFNKSNIQNLANQNQPDDLNQSTVSEGQNNNPDNKELENGNNKAKYIKLVDDYGKIEECVPDTVECLILYLALPDDKQGIEDRFKTILESGYKPDQKQKRLLTEKLKQDPKSLAIQKNSRFQKVDELPDEENVLDGINNDNQNNDNNGDNQQPNENNNDDNQNNQDQNNN